MGLRLRAALFVASCLTPSLAFAQVATPTAPVAIQEIPNSPTSVSEIIVTAQKRSERIQDVPLSITAVTSDQLTKQGITSAADLEKIAPGFTFAESQYGTPVFSIRGIGFYNEQVAAAPTVAIYTDQVPLPYSRMTEGATLDLDRVEVLKGPQGTLFGQNSTGGAVNYIDAKPQSTFHAGTDLTYGRFNEVDADGYVTGPIVDGLNFRLAAEHEGRDDWQTSLTRDDHLGQRDFNTARLLVDWKPISHLHAELNFNGWLDSSDTQAGQARGYLPTAPGPYLTPQSQAEAAALSTYPYYTGTNDRVADWDPNQSFRRNDKFYQGAANIQYDLASNVRLISITGFSYLKSYDPVDSDATYYVGLFLQQKGLTRSFTQELRLEGDISRFKWIVGANYEHDNAFEVNYDDIRGSNSQVALPPPAQPLSFNGLDLYNRQLVDSHAVFVNLDYRATDRLTLQGGIRYTRENRDFIGCLANNGTATGIGAVLGYNLNTPDQCITILPSGATGQYIDALNQNNISWRGSANYKLNRDTLLYVSATKGYKSGDFDTLPALSYQQFAPARQESVIAYEGGIKTSLIDRRLDLSLAVFYDDYRDKQTQGTILVPTFGELPVLTNIPASRIAGFEADTTFRPIRGLTINAGVTYIDTKVTDTALVTDPFGQTIDAKGEKLPLAPPWQAQLDAEYDFPISTSLDGFVGGSVSARSTTDAFLGAREGPAGSQDDFRVDGYGLLGLRAGVTINRNYRVELWGENVTNTGYWNDVTHIYDTYDRLTGLPATYGIRLSAKL